MSEKIILKNKEILDLLGIESPDFPKYSTQLLNLANQNAQATRPHIVGQMSELIKEFSGKTLSEWEEWYLQKHPEAIKMATLKILDMIENLKDVLYQIDYDLIEKWVYDLVIVKTFIGLKFQEAILKKVATLRNVPYRLSTPEEEARGIDGYLGETPISIKPITYKSQSHLQENITGSIIFYEKVKTGIRLEIPETI